MLFYSSFFRLFRIFPFVPYPRFDLAMLPTVICYTLA